MQRRRDKAPPLNPQHLAPSSWFDGWWNSGDLLSNVGTHNAVVPGYSLFRDSALRPLREGYAAALFAYIRSQSVPCEVRLVPDQDRYPDFQLRSRGKVLDFEQTEADREDRRRTDEYREHDARVSQGVPPELEHFDPDREVAEILPVIASRIREKAEMHYRPRPHLLVYVNVMLFTELRLTTLQAIGLAEPGRDHFESIWLLWGGNAVRCFPNPAKIVLREPLPDALR